MVQRKKKKITKPASYPAWIDLNWSVSRARDTEGCNVCTLRLDGKKIGSAMGGGYDLTGAALSEWVSEAFNQQLLPHLWKARRWGTITDGYHERVEYVPMPDGTIVTSAGRKHGNAIAYGYYDGKTGQPIRAGMSEDSNQFIGVMALFGITVERLSNSKDHTTGYTLIDERNEYQDKRNSEMNQILCTHDPETHSVLTIKEKKFGVETHRVDRYHGEFLDLFLNARGLINESLQGWGRVGYPKYLDGHAGRRDGLDTWVAEQDKLEMKEYSRKFLDEKTPWGNTITTAFAYLKEVK